VRWGDEQTPYWFPFETKGGLMAESRVVLPIPPGKRWDEVEPVVFPGSAEREAEARRLEQRASEGDEAEADRAALAELRKAAREAAKRAERASQQTEVVHGVEAPHAAAAPTGFAAPPEVLARQEAEAKAAAAEAKKRAMAEAKREAKAAAKAARRKSDPRLLAFSRELRDRWAEAVAARPGLIGLGCRGKYELGRRLEGGDGMESGFAALGGEPPVVPKQLINEDRTQREVPREAA
jgi:hypothetical protein